MPKKTKKEKILAEYRKKIKLLNRSLTRLLASAKPESTKTPVVANEPPNKENSQFLFYFRQDFRKSFLIVIFIIALEIGLYFAKLIK